MFTVSTGRARTGAALSTAILILTAATACSPGSGSGDLAANQHTLAACPSTTPAARAAIDVSGSVRGQGLPAPYGAALRDLARRTAVCGGHLSVVAFSASSAATASLYDGDLHMTGSTDNSRLRHVPEAVDEVMKTVSEAYATQSAGLTPGGTDIIAQYRLAGEYAGQLGGDHPLDLLILSDGYQNAGTVLGDRALSAAESKSLAAGFEVPQLPGASVTVAGIGKTGDQAPASTPVIDGMKSFYDALCQRTGAAKCASVTDYTPAGG